MTITTTKTTPRLFLLLIGSLLVSTSPAIGQDDQFGKNEPAPDPHTQQASFEVADGFEVTLFAAEPMVAKPIQINFDPQGRLWVASSSVYPQVRPGEVPDDKIVVLEDVDHDGRADKSTVFAGGLLIPTGVVPGDGGAYVANSTDVVHFKDTDGDLKADDYRVALSGFGTEDTHHMIHNFMWGFDGRMYFTQSIYIHAHVETPHGTHRLYGSGVWRYRPESDHLAVVARGMVNPWGHTFDRWGNTFYTDGAGDGGIHYGFPGAAWVSAVGVERLLTGLNPGSPKLCGAELVSGRHLPDDWQGDIITHDFRANRVVRYKLSETDNGFFSSKLMPNVITSTSRYFRPVDVKQGPDGAIYIADWCNQIINHGEVDFRDPRRDKVHGRIWRLSAKGRKPLTPPKLVGQPAAAVLDQLKAPEQWTRQQAKVVLRSLGAKQVIPALGAWVKALGKDDPEAEHHRLEALWVYQGLDVPEPQLLGRLLKSKDHRARAAAVRVVPDWQTQLPNTTELLAAAVLDEHARVRLEAVRALARVPSPQSVEIAMRAREKPVDPFLDYALWLTANELLPVWMPEFKAGRLTFGGRTEQMNWALQAVKSPEALATLVNQLRGNQLPPAGRGDVFDLIAAVGGPAEASAVFEQAIAPDADANTRLRALAALERGIRQRNVRPDNADVGRLADLLSEPDTAVQAAAIGLAGAWDPAKLRDRFLDVAKAQNTHPRVRQAAISALADGGPDNAPLLRQLLDAPDLTHEAKLMAAAGLARLDVKAAAARAAELLTAGAPADADPSILMDAFLQIEGGNNALAEALKGKPLPKDLAKLGLRYVNTTGRDAGDLTAVLREAAGLGAAAKAPTEQEVQAVIAKVQKGGDPHRGETVFRRADMNCFGCHGIGGAGSQVGPDLRSIGASSPLDYIVESILIPNKAIKDGYQSVVVATKKGQVFSGIKVSQDDKQMLLRDAQHDRIVVPLDQVRKERDGGSLMPAGLADTLTEQEFLDLISFLSALGKPGDFGTDNRLVIRRWRVLDPAAADAVAADPKILQSPGADALAWRPAYSLVKGPLPPDALQPGTRKALAVARGQIEVTSAGRIGLELNSTDGLELLINGQPVEVKKQMEPDLPAGVHTLTFIIDTSKRRDVGLDVELKEITGGGHAQPLGGR